MACVQHCQGCGHEAVAKFPYICPECKRDMADNMTLEQIKAEGWPAQQIRRKIRQQEKNQKTLLYCETA